MAQISIAGRYRKKPVVIEAVYFDGTLERARRIALWSRGAVDACVIDEGFNLAYLEIDTLEGKMRCDSDGWIIKGVKGEYYPCKPDIFIATYEPEGESDGTN